MLPRVLVCVTYAVSLAILVHVFHHCKKNVVKRKLIKAISETTLAELEHEAIIKLLRLL